MSAAALRAPARWTDAVRAELPILASVRPLGWVGLFLLMSAVWGGEYPQQAGEVPFEEFRWTVALMFLLPLAWQGRGARERYVPLPVGDAAREGVRVLCGAACAGAILALGLGIYVSVAGRVLAGEPSSPLDVFPRDYPVALTLAGVANYLLGAALMLRSERPGRTLATVLLLAVLATALAGIELERVEFEHVDPYGEQERFVGGTSLTVAAALFRLALGLAAVGLCARLGGVRAPRWPGWPRRAHGGAGAPGRSRAAATLPRTPASAAAVFARQARLLAPRLALPVLALAVHAWAVGRNQVVDTEVSILSHVHGRRFLTTAPMYGLWLAAYVWPVLVWLDERHNRPWDEARPAGILARRLLHAAAGMAWLLAAGLLVAAAYVAGAVEAGMLPSPFAVPAWIWAGVPLAVAATCCMGTLPAVMTGRPLLASCFQLMILTVAGGAVWLLRNPVLVDGNSARETRPMFLEQLLAPLGWARPGDWSAPVALAWTAVFAVLAAAAVWWRAGQDRMHDGLPPVREPRPFIPVAWRAWWAARGRAA